MADFTEVDIPKPVNREALKKSWQKTVEASNEVLGRLTQHQLSKVAGWVPQKLVNGSPKSRLGALMAVYRYEMNQVRRLAIETESFHRLHRRDQDLLRTNFTSKLLNKEQQRVRELLWQLQRSEIQADQKRKLNQYSTSSSQRRRQAKKAERQAKDRGRTLQTKGTKRSGPDRTHRF